jgi:hypothetical protein
MSCPKCHNAVVRGPLFIACAAWPTCPWSEPLFTAPGAVTLPGFDAPTPAVPERQQLELFELLEGC